MLTNISSMSLSQRLFHSIVFFMNSETLSTAEKLMYLDLEERSLVQWAYLMCLTYDRRAGHLLSSKFCYSGEPESCKNLHTSSSKTNHLRTLPLDNHLTSESKRSDLWFACISSHKSARGSLKGGFYKVHGFHCLL
jgi:hypothetical protein